jgi:hypothetical protein
VAEHLPRHHNVEGLCPAIASGIETEKMAVNRLTVIEVWDNVGVVRLSKIEKCANEKNQNHLFYDRFLSQLRNIFERFSC